jgi:nucleotide-binding universal stress UspA family protein
VKEHNMPLSAIMVSVDFDEGTDERVSAAAELARRFNAHLIGVAGWVVREVDAGNSAAVSGEIRQKKALEELELLGEKFRQCAGAIPQGVEWRCSTNFPREVIPVEARAADLVIIRQEGLSDDAYHTYDPGTIILATGRPVLTVPQGISRLQMSEVLIAWKDSREARRAVFDALPLLTEAKNVSIAVAESRGAENVDTQLLDIKQYLLHHNVSVGGQIVVRTPVSGGEGSALLELAQERNANLIVAGAYGRTRLSEWIFGGVTRELLLESNIPCLFSN